LVPVNGVSNATQLSFAFNDWSVRASQRARRLSARVFHDGRVEIVMPVGTSARRLKLFMARSRAWIESALQRAARRAPPPRLVSDAFPPTRLELTALGETWDCVAECHAPQSATALRQALRLRLRQRAAAALTPQVHALARDFGVSVSGVQLRLQRARWGSCTRRGTISLNACLLFQRPEVVRYLLVHELAHRVHLHHGAAFWHLVAQHEPQWRLLDRELAHGFQRVPRWILHPPAGERAS
jgi:predicted metal-dependent hydrolase